MSVNFQVYADFMRSYKRNGAWLDLTRLGREDLRLGGACREQRVGEGSVDNERLFEKRLSRLARLTPEQKLRRWRKLEQM